MAESKDSPKRTRKVKNPETFRERAIKASEESQKPVRPNRLRTALGKMLRPVGSAFRKLGRIKIVRIISKPFRILGRILFPKYFRESYQELKLVEWPDRHKTLRLTIAVLIFALIFAVIVSIIDYGLDKLFREVLLK